MLPASDRAARWRECPTLLLALGALVSLSAVGVALVSQHVFDMQPCPWCVLQRLIFVAIAVVCLVGLAVRRPLAQRIVGGAVLLLSIEGVVAALWQHFVAAASTSCNLTFADRVMTNLRLDALLPQVFQARASCADAAVSLLGVPYEFYSLVLYVLLGIAGALVLAQPARLAAPPGAQRTAATRSRPAGQEAAHKAVR